MSRIGPLNLKSTNQTAFKANGEQKRFKRWLAEVRPDLTRDARRQVTHYARRVLDLFGAEAPQLAAAPPAHVRARIEAVDPTAHGLARYQRRHLLRAARALHAAVHDLDTAATRQLMDRRTPQRRAVRAGARAQAQPDLLAAGPVDQSRAAEPAGAEQAAGDAPTPPRAPAGQQAVAALSHQLTVQAWLDDALDVRGVARALVGTLSPEARVRLVAALPGAAELPVALAAGTAAASPADLAAEALVAILERHADLQTA